MEETTHKPDMKPYLALKKRQQEEYDRFSNEWCFYAFSDSQLEEGLRKMREKLGEDEKAVRFLPGCFVAESRFGELESISDRQMEELFDAMQDDAFAESAFLYEMENHEYGINWDADWDVCSCFPHGSIEYEQDADYREYLRQCGYGEHTVAAYRAAKAQYYRLADENGWL